MKVPRWLQAVVAIGGFALLCADAARRLPDKYPPLRRCVADPARYVGRMIWISHAPVLESGPEHFVVDASRVGPVRIHSTLHPAPGAWVMVKGLYVGGREVRALGTDLDSAYPLRRAAVYAISIAALALVAWLLHRHFAWRDGALRGREPWPIS